MLKALFAICVFFFGFHSPSSANDDGRLIKRPDKTFKYVTNDSERIRPSFRKLVQSIPPGYNQAELLKSLPAQNLDSTPQEKYVLGYAIFGATNSRSVAFATSHQPDQTLFVDLNRNGRFDDNESISTNNATGPWRFELEAEFPVDEESYEYVPHQVVCQLSRNGRSIMFATAGYFKGTTTTKNGRSDVIRTDFNSNGRWADQDDRFLIDANSDGTFDFLTERFRIASSCRIQDAIYNIGADERGFDFTLDLSAGTGTILPKINYQDESASTTALSATLVSEAGVQVHLSDATTSVAAPVGKYRLTDLQIEFKVDEETMTMRFSRLPGSDKGWFTITADQSFDFDPIGELDFSCTISTVDDHGSASLAIHPMLTTSTGCYLTDSRIGGSRGEFNSASGDSFHGETRIDSHRSGFL